MERANSGASRTIAKRFAAAFLKFAKSAALRRRKPTDMKLVKTQITSIDSADAFSVFFAAFTFLSLFAPVSFPEIRTALLIVLVLLTLGKGIVSLSQKGTCFFLAYIIGNIVFLFWGLANNTPGAIRVQTVDLLWPIAFFIFTQRLDSETASVRLERMLLVSYFVVCLFDVLYIASSLLEFSLPVFDFLEDLLKCSFNKGYDGYLEYTTNHLCTHIFMVPFVISLLRNHDCVVGNGFMHVLAGMAIACVLVSGKVALLATSIAFSCFGLVLMGDPGNGIKNLKWFVVTTLSIAVGIALLGALFGIDFIKLADYAIGKLISSIDASNVQDVRVSQKGALLSGWLESSVIGHGSGSYTTSSIRSDDQPWAYEYSYHALLFQKGVLGVGLFFALVAWILITLLEKRKSGDLSASVAVPFFVGLLAIIVANYSNPYLAKMGCMWMLFYPFAIANASSDYFRRQPGCPTASSGNNEAPPDPPNALVRQNDE